MLGRNDAVIAHGFAPDGVGWLAVRQIRPLQRALDDHLFRPGGHGGLQQFRFVGAGGLQLLEQLELFPDQAAFPVSGCRIPS